MRSFVPTMGALHAGHAELIRRAREISDEVVVSIFVNPLQFENPEDLEKYPHTPEQDEVLARNAGATRIWFPTYEEIYPAGFTKLSAGPLGSLFEGASRPGHFDGVVTVVRRLFDLVTPDVALFGEKDFQQLALVRTIAENVEIIAVPIVRERDGLALSSRNIRLSSEGRKAAPIIHQAMMAASVQKTVASMAAVLREKLDSQPLFTTDYAEIVDVQSFQKANDATADKRALVAGWIDGVRLIDNMAMNGGGR